MVVAHPGTVVCQNSVFSPSGPIIASLLTDLTYCFSAINPYNNLHIWDNSFEQVWQGRTSKCYNTRTKYGINFFSRLHVCIQQGKECLLWSFKVNYTMINFQNCINFISHIMLLTQLSVINVHLFSWIWTFCQANITCLLFRALQEQSIVFHKGAVIIQTLSWIPASHLSKFF